MVAVPSVMAQTLVSASTSIGSCRRRARSLRVATLMAGVHGVTSNSGQSCNAATRMLVPNSRMAEVLATAKAAAEATTVGAPDRGAALGSVISAAQWDKIETLIAKGIDEGATVVAGGLGKPEGLATGYCVKPAVLGGVNNQMTVAREEIFGPVLTILATPRWTRRWTRRWRSPTTRPTACRPVCRAATWTPPARWRHACAPARSTSTAPRPT